MIESITLKNFRCFEEFETKLSPITLISGENNSGKSSILEALFLLHDFSAPDSFVKVAQFRGNDNLPITSQLLWENLFYSMRKTEQMRIGIEKGNDSIFISYSIDENRVVNKSPSERMGNASFPLSSNVGNYPLKYKFVSRNYKDTGEYSISQEGVTRKSKETSKPAVLPVAEYISSSVTASPNFIAEQFGNIELAGKTPILVEALQLLDERIVDLKTIVSAGTGSIYATTTDNQRFPIRTMGDGINKLLRVLIIMLAYPPDTVLLLDEVENGFHYSFHRKFWKVVGNLAQKQKCQIIATTHSYECIQGALEGVSDNGLSDLMAYIRLAKTRNTIVPKYFSNEMLEFALESEMEVR